MAGTVRLAGRVRIETETGAAGEEHLAGNQSRLAFAVLLLERRRALTPTELADILWPDQLPGTWQAGLRNVVSRIREFLTQAGIDATEALRHDSGRYRLSLPEGMTVDVEEAEALVGMAAAALADGDGAVALDAATRARTGLGQPVLASIDSPWLDRLRDRLAELDLRAAELEAESMLATGDHRSALAVAETVTEIAPLRESAHRLLMRAHDGAGNRGLALRAYERCRRALADELGIDPSPETEAAYVALLGTEPAEPPDPVSGTAVDVEPDRRRPTGTVTFLFSDIVDSSGHWERDPEGMAAALQVHDDIFDRAVDDHGGRVFKHTGDGVGAVFAAARDALWAAVDAQRSLLATEWPSASDVRVRIGMHTGEAELRGDDYAGVALNRAARVCDLVNGGQILASSSTRLVVEGRTPPDVELHYVGDVQLRGMTLHESVYQVKHPELPGEQIALESAPRPLTAAPIGDGTVVGRADDLAAVSEALTDARLVSIVGLGGVGKTRLASEIARTCDLAAPARTWWAELSATDADGVAHALADLLGAGRPGSGPVDAAVEELDRAPSLIVLDNCEHVIDAAASLAEELLHRCVDLRILATSRIPLGIASEHVVALGPLPTPPDDAPLADILASPAVEIFTRRARAASSAFRLDPDNASSVAEICRRLDGLPLAIELAAARVRSLAPAQIASHLDRRFRLLRRADRGHGDARHRDLEEVLGWTWELLDEHECRLLDRLSVLAGAFGLGTAVALAGDETTDELDVLDVLDGLVERSLVATVDDPIETRYQLFESVRAFGRGRLEANGELATIVARHRVHHRTLVEDAAVGLRGSEELAWVRAVSSAFPDIRTAFVTARADEDVDTCLRMVVALYDYAFFRMRGDVAGWAVDATTMAGAAEHPAFADASAVAGFLAWQRGDVDTARRWIERADAAGGGWIADDAAGTIAIFQGDVQTAIERWRSAVTHARADGQRQWESIALTQVAFGHVFEGDLDTARTVAVEAMAVAEESGNPTARSQAHWCLGVAEYDRDPEVALGELEVAMALGRAVDNRMSVGSAAVSAEELRADLAHRSRTADLAATIERLDYWLATGNTPTLWGTVRRVARLLAELGAHESAALALGAVEAAELKLPLRERERKPYEAVVASVRSALGDDGFDRWCARAASLSTDELVDELRRAALVTTT